MDIAYWTMPGGFNLSTGYGQAGFNIIRSLQALGHNVPYGSTTAPVRLAFCQPQYYKKIPGQYFIGYTPWESTELPEGWVDQFNEDCDEVWTTSNWCKQVYIDAGVTKPVHVYEHGVDSGWTPVRRNGTGKVKFLHIGEPAPRKAGQMVFDSFVEAFGDRSDVHLTIKAHEFSTIRRYDRQGSILGQPDDLGNVTQIRDTYSTPEMINLVQQHDVLVYPSWGEGFGFIPAQALATGMPTICTLAWAGYKSWLGPLALQSRLVDSPWQPPHWGKMFEPDREHLKQQMLRAVRQFDVMSDFYYRQATPFNEEYSWESVTKRAFQHITDRFGNS